MNPEKFNEKMVRWFNEKMENGSVKMQDLMSFVENSRCQSFTQRQTHSKFFGQSKNDVNAVSAAKLNDRY